MTRPLALALALDHDVDDVVRMAGEMAQRLGAPVIPIHALGRAPWTDESEARAVLEAHLAPLVADEQVEVAEPILVPGRPAAAVIDEAVRRGAQMILTGGGGPATLRRWVFGSTAEAIVRGATCPVYVVRGVYPVGDPILCPVDLSPQSRMGLRLALRMARLLETSLTVLNVVDEPSRGSVDADELTRRVEEEEAEALKQIEWFLEPVDTSGVEVTAKAMIGPPAQRIVEASEDAGLLVIGSRGFDLLRPTAIGDVTEKVVRFSRIGVITVRDVDPARDERESQIQRVADLKHRADEALDAGDAQSALPLLQLAASIAPVNPVIQERLGDALAEVGRKDEAEHRRALARMIRERFG